MLQKLHPSCCVGSKPKRAVGLAVLLTPYDLREMTMLGDAGSNALGALLGLGSVKRLAGWRRKSIGTWGAIVALGALTAYGERKSLGSLIEKTPGLRELDAFGRQSA